MPTTTPPSSESVELPDCSLFTDDVVSDDLLDLIDAQALIRALAEEGIEGAKALLQDTARNDPKLAGRLAEMREKLRRQAERQLRRRMEEYDQRVERLELVSRKDQADIDAAMAELEARLKAARQIDLRRIDTGLLDEVRSALLLPDSDWIQAEARPTLLERLRALFARLLEWLRGLFGRSKKGARPSRKERTITLAGLAGSARTLGNSELGDALARLSPGEQKELSSHVSHTLEAKERDLQREAEEKRKQSEAQRRELEAERAEAARRTAADGDRRVKEAEERRLNRELKERGLVADQDGKLSVTYGLVERFARLVLEEETRKLPGDVRLSLRGNASTGVYEKARLRQPEEVAHLDIPSSLLAARLLGSKHIDEDSSYVYREVTSERVHVVLLFDKSGSMSEGNKLPAAKKAFLALYVAIRRRHPEAVIDVVAFENEVKLLDLLELWECSPGSFTNTAEALHTAHLLLRASRATRREVYLVTDGLPEAYTETTGRVLSGNLDAAMEHALVRAGELATVVPLKFSMILLRSEHPEYEVAARRITRTLSGDLVITDPNRLGVELLVRWAGGTETIRRPAPSGGTGEASRAPVPPGAGKPRRRKSDRRMGG
ncbi:MAG: hypothetical protein L3K19_00050 [Thermoplasmata archaeon]|nr:hypothetical protein [Thermoplasmata archaeon]